MKKILIILFFTSVLIYSKAEAYTLYVYSEDIEKKMKEYMHPKNREEMEEIKEYVEAVSRAFANSGHRIAYNKNSYFDYYAIVEVTINKEGGLILWCLAYEKVEVELKVTIVDPQLQYYIAMESVKGGSIEGIGNDSPDELAEKVVKRIDKALKNRKH